MYDKESRTDVVNKPYQQPYPDLICVAAHKRVSPDFDKMTNLPG